MRLLLIHIGFSLPIVKWIMTCVTFASFSILINGVASGFFRSSRGLRPGCPLSPRLFLPVAEGLNKALIDAKRRRTMQDIRVGW